MNPLSAMAAALRRAHAPRPALLGLLTCLAWLPPGASAQALNFAQTPLFLGTTVKPNVLVVYDNSQSMDGTMAGKLIAGNDDTTRGNIARSVLRSTIASYRNSFNWGLASFDIQSSSVYTTYAYFFGADAEVLFTNDCVNGLSASNANLRCMPNPQPANGFNFLTYKLSGDDPAINDVLYAGDNGTQIWGIGVNGSTKYKVFGDHRNTSGWNDGDFTGEKYGSPWSFSATDAGYLPATPPNRRLVFVKRAWGYYAGISGKGKINQSVAADSDTQYNALMALLARETGDNTTGELKNAAVFTPLAGTLGTVKDYFGNTLSGKATPITQSCQRNFVLLATDGNPTGKTDGNMYALADQVNTYNPATGTWSFGTAANDVFTRITNLRSTSYNTKTYDVQTYVVGLGDSVANASSVATLNRMASLGGTDAAYLASDQNALAAAFRAISVDIISRTAAASSVSLNAGSWNTGAKVYQGRFSSGDWSGQLLSLPIGGDGTPGSTPDWDAGQKLNAQHWSTGRQILTYKPSAALGSRGVPFRWPANAAAPAAGEMDLAVVTALNKNGSGTADGYGSQRLEYIRGNTAREVRNCAGCSAPTFRDRPISVLGDIVNSAPVYVGGPTGDYRDTMETARYSTYANSRASQTPMIYVGANDGMLHAFNASTGGEVFAYVPYAVRNRLSALTSNPYTHYFSVDGSPAVGDVSVGGSWKTLLVSGMSAGAPGLFALDVSNPGNFTEAKAAQVVRWEIGDSDADVGHIFGRAILSKTRDGRWRAIVGNGYNSANGRAVLMLVDLENGAITKIDTGVGAADNPNGLSSVTAVSTADNGVVDIVYAGDLRGNLWKFDLSSASSSAWTVAYKNASNVAQPLFTAASGQPITARPDVTRFPSGGWMISFGTGRYIDITDNSAGSGQSVYGIWDNGAPVALGDLQTQSFGSTTVSGSDGKSYRMSTHAVGVPKDTLITGDNAITLANYYLTKKGWKLALPSSGERVVSQATVRGGRLVLSSLVPSTAVCAFGGDGWIIDVDVITGNRAEALDTNGDAVIDDRDKINGSWASAVNVGSVPAAVTIMKVKKRDRKFGNTSSGALVLIDEKSNAERSRRAAWEQLQ
ncbi:pilus assembly protein [Aquabacterium sp. OR-4]|uniref:pilus assembly protein n=1 Tax=Aquabacterium sp. OR-4 TaxID=2978127 RepID=UPI0021B2DC19|nr:PilC/PilY family type IV pilus protein [Aquabacterium sp. OR-4]MDT7834246.1 PilC/PilY family type IV pilus protein [Aquabacterium sp. OR-4]